MQYVFQMEAQKDFQPSGLESFLCEKNAKEQKQYITCTINAVCDNIQNIDAAIEDKSQGWSIQRMAKADLAILRTAAAEILYNSSIPKSVSINEAVELAKAYGDEKSSGFINAVLKNIG